MLTSQDGDESKRNADVLDILQRCDFSDAALYDQTMATSSATMLGEAMLHTVAGVMQQDSGIYLKQFPSKC